MIEKQMGNKSPCEDFHNYVCGKWKGDLELNETKLKKKAVRALANLLEKASTPSAGMFNATDKLIQAFKSCTMNGRSIASLKTSVERVIRQYNFTQWPIYETGVELPLTGSNAYMDVLKKSGPRPVFSYSISDESSSPVIMATKPWGLYVPEDQEFIVPQQRSDAMSEIEGEAEPTPVDYAQYDEALRKEENSYKAFITKTIRLLDESASEEKARDVAEGIVRIEKKFGELTENAKDPEEQRVNISQLNDLVGGGFSMDAILQRDFEGLEINIDEGTEVVVRYIKYYQAAVQFMKCSTMAELANYVLWTKIRKMAEATGTLLNDIYVEYKHNTSLTELPHAEASSVVEGTEKTSRLRLPCMRQLLESGVMYTAAAHFYIMAKFNDKAKKDVIRMMEFVNSSFMHVVEGNTWMSERTKKEAITRLQTMDAVIGYPDWMLNETIINTMYHYVPSIEENASFAEHYHFLLENEHKRKLLQLKPEMYFDKVNETVTLRSHAYYVDSSNSLVYPAAALVTHYRVHPVPRSLKFGTIGTILAQLFVASIERYSHLPSEKGKYKKDIWDNETTDKFCKGSSCLNNTEECNDTSPPASEKHEKLRDYLGLRISFEAMQKSKQNYTPPFVLPDNKFDNESKIFFILFGSLYCPISVNEKRVQSRSAEGEKYNDTLNEIVYIYDEFNKTFNCDTTPGADTCQLMPPDGPTPLPNC